MSQQTGSGNDAPRKEDASSRKPAGNEQQDELEAEQESAAAMDADVPQPPGADETTEGQPS
jgi:hypothetical protein